MRIRSQNKRTRGFSSRRVVRLASLHVALLSVGCLIVNLMAVSNRGASHGEENGKKENETNATIVTSRSLPSSCRPAKRLNATNGKPVWVPGYPGSGSELFRSLVEAATGLEAANVYEVESSSIMTCNSSRTITCKTHWPLVGKRPPYRPARIRKMSHDAAFLLLRNPAKAIPSYFNYIWETSQQHASIHDHTTQAPEATWRTWRDANFHREMRTWTSTIARWHNQDAGPYSISRYIPYEDMVHNVTGPVLFHELLNDLRRQSHNIPVDGQQTACLWRLIVQERPTKKRNKVYTPGFTAKQKQFMLRELAGIQSQVTNRPLLRKILEEYKQGLQDTLVIDS